MRAMVKRPVREKKPASGENVDPHKAIADEFDEPIVVPFRGMFKVAADEPSSDAPTAEGLWRPSPDAPTAADAPTAEELRRDGTVRQLEKLKRLGDRYGIDLNDPDGWQLLALRIAHYYHPGFKLVYDDWKAYYFHSLWGFTPCFPLKGKSPKPIESEYNWTTVSKLLQPEFLALLVNGRHSKRSDERICEILVVAADEKMKMRKNQLEKAKRTATLVRRLSEGRKRLKSQQHTTGKKTHV
jgi:hypothetical protein